MNGLWVLLALVLAGCLWWMAVDAFGRPRWPEPSERPIRSDRYLAAERRRRRRARQSAARSVSMTEEV